MNSTQVPVLHAVRLLGFADTPEVAIRARLPVPEAATALADAEARGWLQHTGFADLYGWSLTDAGRTEGERILALERQRADGDGELDAIYAAFLPLNARLLRACTDWQIRPTPQEPLAVNDHDDPAWDRRVLGELEALSHDLTHLVARLAAVLPRFAGYDDRFQTALQRAQAGERDWVDRSDVDSCHRVWFELHEDLVATLGIDRRTEY